MVRLKTRYILFEVLFPERKDGPVKDPYETLSKSTVFLHQPTPAKVDGRQIQRLIKASLQKNFGDFGSSMGIGMTVRYFSPRTSTGIIRVTRAQWKYIVAALTFISSLEGEKCIFNTVAVSGSIKKCEDRSIERSKEILRTVAAEGGSTEELDLVSQLLSEDKHDSNT